VASYTQTQNIDEPLAMLRGATASYYEAERPRFDHIPQQFQRIAYSDLHIRFVR
jgi:hypothetical protein